MSAADGNLWQATEPRADAGPPPDGDVTADVAIIGGGITGLSAALHLAQAGAQVRLLEARRVGHGGSGRNVGLVNAGLWTPPEEVARLLGPGAGDRLNTALAAAPDLVFELIESHGIACDAIRNGTLHCADTRRGRRELQDRFRQLSALGAPVRLMDAAEVAARTGSRRFLAALWDGRAGTIQPLAYVRGLARAARQAGAVIHEDAPASSVRRTAGGWRLSTTGGSVTAARLVQATNAYGTPGLPHNGFVPVHFFQCATAPLPPARRRTILPGGEGCWDTARVLSSFRLDAAGRLLIGAVGDAGGFGQRAHRAWAARKLAQLYPELAAAPFDFTWSGRIAMTPDHLPRVAMIGPGAVSIFGYSGRGIAPGTLFGKAAARWADAGDEAAFPVDVSTPGPVPLAGLRACAVEAGAVLTHAVSARL